MKRQGANRIGPRTSARALAVSLVLAGPTVRAADDAPATLRATGLYRGGAGLEVAADVLRFSPQYPLWSDGAQKERWVRLPVRTAIDASRPDAWDFPVGTRFWKEFRLGTRKVETRVIDRLPDGQWRFTAYVWNAAGTEAVRAPAQGLTTDIEIAPGKRYVVPAEIDCRSCHEGRSTPILGFTALQLSPDRDPLAPHAEAPGTGLDLPALVARGLVKGLPDELLEAPPRVKAASPTARAALGYLAANCGTCHNSDGPLAGLEMTLDPGVGSQGAAVLGSTVGRSSRYLPPGQMGEPVRIHAGRPDTSVLVTRMRSRDPLVQMPPLGTQLVDQQGLALIERWIAETRAFAPSKTASNQDAWKTTIAKESRK